MNVRAQVLIAFSLIASILIFGCGSARIKQPPASPKAIQVETKFEVTALKNYGMITWDTTLLAPDIDRIVSLLDLFFKLHPNTPEPRIIKIKYLSYRDFEVELAKSEVGLGRNRMTGELLWQAWLRGYKTTENSRLVGGFVRNMDLRLGEVEIVTAWLNDNTIVHEMSHWACYTMGPEIRSGPHTGSPWGDCTTAITNDLLHSLKYRTWLRDRSWRR